MTYDNFISQFEILDNPPYKKGYHRHHIIPEAEQVKVHGSVIDNRQVYLSLTQHFWAHILYDKEHGTKTSDWFLKMCGKPFEFFDSWEKCLSYSYTLRKKVEERSEKSKSTRNTDDFRQYLSQSMKGRFSGEKNPWYGKSYVKGTTWWNNGVENKRSNECPGPDWKQGRTEFSEEVIQNMKSAAKKRDISKFRKAGQLARIGSHQSEESKRKMSEKAHRRTGEKNSVFGKHWFNDGVKNIRAKECPPGFVPGILKKEAV